MAYIPPGSRKVWPNGPHRPCHLSSYQISPNPHHSHGSYGSPLTVPKNFLPVWSVGTCNFPLTTNRGLEHHTVPGSSSLRVGAWLGDGGARLDHGGISSGEATRGGQNNSRPWTSRTVPGGLISRDLRHKPPPGNYCKCTGPGKRNRRSW